MTLGEPALWIREGGLKGTGGERWQTASACRPFKESGHEGKKRGVGGDV